MRNPAACLMCALAVCFTTSAATPPKLEHVVPTVVGYSYYVGTQEQAFARSGSGPWAFTRRAWIAVGQPLTAEFDVQLTVDQLRAADMGINDLRAVGLTIQMTYEYLLRNNLLPHHVVFILEAYLPAYQKTLPVLALGYDNDFLDRRTFYGAEIPSPSLSDAQLRLAAAEAVSRQSPDAMLDDAAWNIRLVPQYRAPQRYCTQLSQLIKLAPSNSFCHSILKNN